MLTPKRYRVSANEKSMGEQQQPQQGYSSVNTLRSLAIIAKSTIRQGVHERGNTFCGENHFNIMQTFELNEPDHWKMATYLCLAIICRWEF